MSLYCGEIGLSISEFNDCTMQDLYNINSGFLRQKENQWIHTRSVICTLININSTEKITPQDVIKLSCDNKKGFNNMTEKERKEGIEWSDKLLKQIKK